MSTTLNYTDEPKISIITICRNAEEVILETVESVLTQSYAAVEYIVIDGASTDATLALLQPYQNKVSYFSSEPDKGVYDAMNKGLKAATGEWVFFLNAGDSFYSATVLKNFTRYAARYPHVSIFYGDVWDVDGGESKKRKKQYLSKLTLFQKMICHQTIFARRSLFVNNGGFDLHYKIKADYEWLMRNLFAGASSKYIPLDISYYQQGGLSSTAYNTVSVVEIPRIRQKYYTSAVEKTIRRFLLNPRVVKIFPYHLRSPYLLRMIDSLL